MAVKLMSKIRPQREIARACNSCRSKVMTDHRRTAGGYRYLLNEMTAETARFNEIKDEHRDRKGLIYSVLLRLPACAFAG